MPAPSAIRPPAGGPHSHSPGGALLAALRPAQWLKNVALLAAPLFAQKLFHPDALAAALAAVAAFCALASAGYLVNDVADRERDRHHPEKRRRPVAAGTLPVRRALVASAILAAAGLAIAVALGPLFLACALGYLALQTAYTLWLKHLVIVDVFAVAAGFVLRVVAGAEAVMVPISNWLYLCTLLLSLFLALAKRRDELTRLAGDAASHRLILAEYSVPLVDQCLTIVSACTVLAYALYTVSADTVAKFGTDHLKMTVPFVLFGLFRYLYLVHRRGAGGEPEQVLLRDRATQLNLAAYLATVLWVLYR
jgi:4-hydroxybenzoate polyprenyltransferase